jgi:predicted dehydrogenase
MTTYRVAVIGCGNRSRAHLRADQLIDGLELVACCDPVNDRRESLAAEFNLRVYADASSMLEAEKPDLVHLVTQPAQRVDLMNLISGVEVPMCTVEKPIATGVGDWQSLCKLDQQSKTRFAISHQFRWHQHLVKCQRALASGLLGEVKFLDISAGMNIANQGTHTLNYGRFLLGDPRVIQVAGNAYGWDTGDATHPAPEATEAYLVFENGVRGLWTLGPISPRIGDPATTWQHVRVALYANRGRVNYEEFGRWEIISPRGVERGEFGGMDIWAQNNLLAQAEFHKALIAWGKDDALEPGTSLRQSLHEWKVVLAVYTSAVEHRAVEIDSFTPENDLFHKLAERLRLTKEIS